MLREDECKQYFLIDIKSMYSSSKIKVGKKFIMDDQPYETVSYAQKVMGRGGSIINVKAKNLLTGSTVTKTFSDHDKFEEADISVNSYDYLYNLLTYSMLNCLPLTRNSKGSSI